MADTDTVKERQIRIVVDATSAKAGVGEISRALSDIDDKLGKLGDSVVGGFKKLGQGLLAFISFETIKSNISSLISAFDQLGSRAQTLGVSTDWLQGFEAAAARASVKLTTAGDSLDKWAKLVGEAQLGTKSAVDTLDALNVKIYDSNRQIRPLSDTYVDVAKSLDALTGTAKGNALGIQALGKEYQRLAPMMGEVAKGSDAMAAAAGKLVVSPDKIAVWSELATNADKTMLKWRAFAGQNFAEPVKAGFETLKGVADLVFTMFDRAWKALEKISMQFTGNTFAENISKVFGGIAAIVGQAVDKVSELLGGVQGVIDFIKNYSRESAGATLIKNELNPNREALGRADEHLASKERLLQTARNDYGRNPTGAARNRLTFQETEYATARQVRDEIQADLDAGSRRYMSAIVGSPTMTPGVVKPPEWLSGDAAIDQEIANWSGYKPDPKRTGGTTGAYGATATGSGGGSGDRLTKRLESLKAEAAAQKDMAAAALEGAAAVGEQEARFKALQQALEVYGDKAKATDPSVQKLAKTFLEFNRSIGDDKALQQFRLGTIDIERSNDLLQRRLDLVGAAPEIVAREVALVQVRNEASKLGLTYSDEDIKRRADALEKQELLNQKIQQEQETRQLWLEPMKQGLRDIQTFSAQMWDNFLDKGQLTFQSITDFAKTTARKIAAEFLALATIRPVIGVTVGALSGAGILPTSYAQQLGYGSYTSSGSGGGLGGMNMPSVGGGGMSTGWMGDVGSWLNTPMTGPYAGMSPSSMAGVPTLSPSMMNPSTWGITPLQGIGAAAGAGMGIYQLINSKSTSGTIGGIASILGAGVSLIPGIGQIAGPLIGLLGNLLPGMLGMDAPPLITNQEYGQLAYGAGGFGTSGGAWGPDANARNLQGPLGAMGSTMQGIFDALGGVQDAAKVWGVAMQSNSQSQGNWSFSNRTSFLVDPNGVRRQWGQGSNDSDIGMEAAGVAATLESILAGAVGKVSENLTKGLGLVNLDGHGTFAQLAGVVTQIKAFDDAISGLDKTMTTAEQAVSEIDGRFLELYATATQYGLATTDLDAAKAKARLGYATDFGQGISRELLQMTDPQAAALADLDAWKQGLIDNNKWLVENVTGALDQIVEIERLYGLKRAEIVEKGTELSLGTLEDAIKRLTMGDLAGLSPTAALGGSKATYDALLAKASAGDVDAANALGGAATDYAGIARSVYASSPEYEAIRQQMVVQLAQVAVNQGGSTAAGDLALMTQAIAVLGQNISSLQQQIGARGSANDNTELYEQLSTLVALMQRIATHQG